MSASADRIDVHWLREQLVRASCAACEGAVDVHAHRAVYITPGGLIRPHLVCALCWSSRNHAEIAERVELNLMQTEGHA